MYQYNNITYSNILEDILFECKIYYGVQESLTKAVLPTGPYSKLPLLLHVEAENEVASDDEDSEENTEQRNVWPPEGLNDRSSMSEK
jgi:hypothetical protein